MAHPLCFPSFPYPGETPAPHCALDSETFESLYTLVHRTPAGDELALGLVRPEVVAALREVPEALRGPLTVDAAARTLRVFEQPTEAERTAAVAAVMDHWRATDAFAILRGWRDERWPVYGAASELLYSVERAAAGLLGVMRYGVHLCGYVAAPGKPHGLEIWVPRRAADKSTYPGMLDNTAAGGLMTGEDPFECMVREANEEADLPEALMRERCKPVGTVTYVYVTDERSGERGLVYPETQWVYEIEIPTGQPLVAKDGEVGEFYLWTVDRIQEALANGEFKPNCALILIDFFIRHGIITRADEPDYDEILRRLHRKVPFPGPHQTP